MAKTARETLIELLRTSMDKKLLHLAIALAFVIFLATKSNVFALLCAALIIIFMIAESVLGASDHGWKSELKEIAIAVVVALAFWFGSAFILGTSAPYDAVVSCSMLPNLERGDLVVVQGASPAAPVVALSAEEWSAYDRNKTSLWGECVILDNRSACDEVLKAFEGPVEERNGPVTFVYGVCQWSNGERIPCAKSLVIGNTTIYENLVNDIVVYDPQPTDLFARSGAIIHRVFAVVAVEGERYYFIKGDNNPIFDVQAAGVDQKSHSLLHNSPVPASRIHGKVIARVPFLGYIKLLTALAVDDSGCETHIVH